MRGVMKSRYKASKPPYMFWHPKFKLWMDWDGDVEMKDAPSLKDAEEDVPVITDYHYESEVSIPLARAFVRLGIHITVTFGLPTNSTQED
jgi:hypothetical protein